MNVKTDPPLVYHGKRVALSWKLTDMKPLKLTAFTDSALSTELDNKEGVSHIGQHIAKLASFSKGKLIISYTQFWGIIFKHTSYPGMKRLATKLKKIY